MSARVAAGKRRRFPTPAQSEKPTQKRSAAEPVTSIINAVRPITAVAANVAAASSVNTRSASPAVTAAPAASAVGRRPATIVPAWTAAGSAAIALPVTHDALAGPVAMAAANLHNSAGGMDPSGIPSGERKRMTGENHCGQHCTDGDQDFLHVFLGNPLEDAAPIVERIKYNSIAEID